MKANKMQGMRRAWFAAGVAVLTSGAAFAQGGGATPSFEVASIKPAEAPTMTMGGGAGGGMTRLVMRAGTRGGPGTSDPGQITYNGATLKTLLIAAYNVKPFQITGPAFLDSERFDIVAKIPKGASKDDVPLMLQNMLAERFKLTIHREKKDLPMYALVVAKNGPKMKESADDPPADAAKDDKAPGDDPKADAARQAALQQMMKGKMEMKDGMPVMPTGFGRGGGNSMMMMNGRMRITNTKQSMAKFADFLSQQLSRPVVDQTGLTKNYDFTLDFAPEEGQGMKGLPMGVMPPMPPPPSDGGGAGPGGSPESAAPTLTTALQEQMGLKLEQKKGPVDLIVVDHVEKTATDN